MAISFESKKSTELIEGLIVTAFRDTGPQVLYNYSSVAEEHAHNLSVKGMTSIGMEAEREIYGPLPVPGEKNRQCLAYTFFLGAPESQDSRIAKLGRQIVIWIIFDGDRKRDALESAQVLQFLFRVLIRDLGLEQDFDLTAFQVEAILAKIRSFLSMLL